MARSLDIERISGSPDLTQLSGTLGGSFQTRPEARQWFTRIAVSDSSDTEEGPIVHLTGTNGLWQLLVQTPEAGDAGKIAKKFPEPEKQAAIIEERVERVFALGSIAFLARKVLGEIGISTTTTSTVQERLALLSRNATYVFYREQYPGSQRRRETAERIALIPDSAIVRKAFHLDTFTSEPPQITAVFFCIPGVLTPEKIQEVLAYKKQLEREMEDDQIRSLFSSSVAIRVIVPQYAIDATDTLSQQAKAELVANGILVAGVPFGEADIRELLRRVVAGESVEDMPAQPQPLVVEQVEELQAELSGVDEDEEVKPPEEEWEENEGPRRNRGEDRRRERRRRARERLGDYE